MIALCCQLDRGWARALLSHPFAQETRERMGHPGISGGDEDAERRVGHLPTVHPDHFAFRRMVRLWCSPA